MERSEQKIIQKRRRNNRLGMFFIAGVVLAALIVLMYNCRQLEKTVAIYTARAAELELEYEQEQNRTEEIKSMKDYLLTDEYTEQAAREYLGLVKENEIIFEEEK